MAVNTHYNNMGIFEMIGFFCFVFSHHCPGGRGDAHDDDDDDEEEGVSGCDGPSRGFSQLRH